MSWELSVRKHRHPNGIPGIPVRDRCSDDVVVIRRNELVIATLYPFETPEFPRAPGIHIVSTPLDLQHGAYVPSLTVYGKVIPPGWLFMVHGECTAASVVEGMGVK